jgi:hypothetical protein
MAPPAESTTADPQTDVPAPILEEGEHDRFAHYVIGGNEAIVRSMVTGEPVTALCGKVWVPSRNPDRYPVCKTCEEIKNAFGG